MYCVCCMYVYLISLLSHLSLWINFREISSECVCGRALIRSSAAVLFVIRFCVFAFLFYYYYHSMFFATSFRLSFFLLLLLLFFARSKWMIFNVRCLLFCFFVSFLVFSFTFPLGSNTLNRFVYLIYLLVWKIFFLYSANQSWQIDWILFIFSCLFLHQSFLATDSELRTTAALDRWTVTEKRIIMIVRIFALQIEKFSKKK